MHVASVEVSNGPATSATSSGEGRVLSDGGGVFFCSSSLSSPLILIPKPLDSPGDDAARVPKPIAPFVPEPNTAPKLAFDAKPVEENAVLDSCGVADTVDGGIADAPKVVAVTPNADPNALPPVLPEPKADVDLDGGVMAVKVPP